MKRTELFWSEITAEQEQTIRETNDKHYSPQNYSLFNLSRKVIIYPNEDIADTSIREAHVNLLSAYLANKTVQIAISEQRPTGSYVTGVRLRDQAVVAFSQTGIGDGRFLELIKDAVVEINNNLSPLTGRRNLIPELK